MASNQSRQVSIFVNGDKAISSVKEIAAAMSEANNRLAKMVIGSDEYIAQLEEVKSYRAVLQQHNDALKGVDKSLQNIDKHKDALNGVGRGWEGLKNGLQNYVGLAAGAFAIDSIIAAGTALFKTGVEMESLAKKAKTVFGEALPQITQEAEKNAMAMGLTTQQYVAAASAAQDLLVPMGFQRKEAAGISAQLINLSGALSEWTGGQIDSTRVSEILTKALLGEREELKSLGISISEADVQAALAEKGLQDLTGATLQQAEATTTLELILSKSTDAQAQFAAESDSAARRQAELAARFQEIAEKLAVLLLPVFEKLVSVIGVVVEVAADLTDGISAMVNPAESASKAFDEQTSSVNNLETNISPLLDRYDELQGRLLNSTEATALNKEEQAELKKIVEQVSGVIPIAAKGFDEYGRAIGLNTDKAREFIEAEKARRQVVNAEAIGKWQKVIADAEEQKMRLEKLRDFGKTETVAMPGVAPRLREFTNEEMQNFSDQINGLKNTVLGANAELDRLTGRTIEMPVVAPPKTGGETTGKDGKDGTGKPKVDPEAEARKETEIENAKFAARYAAVADSLAKIRELSQQGAAQQTADFAAQQQTELQLLMDSTEQKKLIELNFNEEQAAAAEQIRMELISDQEWELEQVRNHYAGLIALAEQYGLDTSALQEQQSQKLNEIEKKYADENVAEQQRLQQERLQALQSSFSAFGDFITASFELIGGEGEKSAKFQKLATLAKIAFDTASAISSLVASSSANPANATTFGAAGIAQYVSGFARIIANIAQAKKILTSAPEVKQKAEGGFLSVTGASDGRTYNARTMGTPSTGLLPNYPVLFRSNATGSPVLASERGSEYFVSSSDLANPAIANYVRIIDTLSRSGGRVQQFAEGGAVTPTPSGAGIDTATMMRTTAAIEQLVQVLQSGILAVVPDRTIIDIQKRFKDINNATGGYYG
jgi:hypothetical protein